MEESLIGRNGYEKEGSCPDGRADKVDRDYDDTEYIYFSSDYRLKMEFKVVGGTIVKIKCEMRD